jgi:hypothetical protein
VSSSVSGVPGDVQPFTEEFVQYLIPLPEPYGMEDIAFSFPVFEIGAERTRESIRLGDFQVVKTKTSWTLLGDGAQSTVRFNRLPEVHEKELYVRVAFGPVFQAYQDLPDPTFVYEFRRGIGGWHKMSYKREFSPSSQQTFDISQKPTAEQDARGNRR